VRSHGDALIVAPHGEIDLATVEDVRRAIERAHDGKSTLLIDLRGVAFLDTSGLRLIVEQNNRARDGDYSMQIVRGPAPVQRVFEIAGLEPKLPFTDDAPTGA
jgi:anti-sigma B factor antagonist